MNASNLVQLRNVNAKFDDLRLAHDSCDEKLKLANDEIEKLKFSSPTCLESSISNSQTKTCSNCGLLEGRLNSSQETIQQMLYHEIFSCSNM